MELWVSVTYVLIHEEGLTFSLALIYVYPLQLVCVVIELELQNIILRSSYCCNA